ncbi:molybdopterin-dependent oxidoreductase [Actinomarinicola tropica]|uniref:Molybdopterin-dependent oxidoreductase n=1 Tax=Actinomarinicola tropica TaxID=2789776 RepID=A0A5Q2RI29_9ACTN|nr:molybdopterin-dependent oxidoreductase [Actinomarinicola tropica]QGG96449.1 molybdopterin-dependent oxidoreductase [Actinomarinicola tropica]
MTRPERSRRRLHPELWVGLSPNGIGQQKPNHYREMLEVAVDNLRRPAYAMKVLRKGVCDGCALGVAGFHDWTIDGVHLCTTRLRLLEVNTADPLDEDLLSDVGPLRRRSGTELRRMGRLAHPMRRRRGEPGFRRITWDEALDALADGLRTAPPERSAIYLTSRGLTNETYYVAGKAARAMGISSVDSAARVCHAPSTLGLKETIGVAASTCSLQDVIESDLVVLWGTNPANNQPVFMKYLYLARRRGCRVVVVNPYLEPGLERYWVPSNVESALFGTRMCDLHVPVRPGGDVAFANAVLKVMLRRDAVDREWVAAHVEGWDELVAALADQDLDDLLDQAGLTHDHVEAFVDEYAAAGSAVLVWSMGITQHRDSVDGVRAIVNVGLARGNVGRDGAGLMPIRGHSGVQGGAEMGAYATAFPGGATVDAASAGRLAEQWGFDVPSEPGLTAPEMIEAAERGDLDVLWASGGNFLDVLPEPPRVEAALGNVPLRVHQDVVVSSQMLVDGDDVILLPVATRYEQEGGGTSTTTERRVAFSPEIPRRVGEARSEWRLFADVAGRVRPDLRHRFSWPTNRDLRVEIAEVVPAYAGIEHLSDTGDAVQWGGRHLCAGGAFPTPSGRGRATAITPRRPELPEGAFTVATRRGKQFNSMVWSDTDPLTGAGRHAVFIDEADAARLGLAQGDRVRLASDVGSFDGTVHLARLPHRTLQVMWPEGQALIGHGSAHREPASAIPDYNAVVTLEPLGAVGTVEP